MLLYHLQRHSDHHANPTRRYQALRDFEESPVLPTGYAGMIVLAIVPADLAPGDGPARARPLRRRPEPGQHQPPQAGPDPREVRRAAASTTRRLAAIGRQRRDGSRERRGAGGPLPGCGYTYEVEAGDEHEGFAAGTAWADIPDSWCCPDCGVREKLDFVPVERVDGLMRIVVDRDLCEGLGMCEAMAHEFFELDDDDKMHVLDETPGEEHRGAAGRRDGACPVLALSLAG